ELGEFSPGAPESGELLPGEPESGPEGVSVSASAEVSESPGVWLEAGVVESAGFEGASVSLDGGVLDDGVVGVSSLGVPVSVDPGSPGVLGSEAPGSPVP